MINFVKARKNFPTDNKENSAPSHSHIFKLYKASNDGTYCAFRENVEKGKKMKGLKYN